MADAATQTILAKFLDPKPVLDERAKRLRAATEARAVGRSRLWKVELLRFADETGLKVSACHFPSGTSKWNRIEHRMFSRITENRRGRPLVGLEAVAGLIVATTTRKGLEIHSELDDGEHPTRVKVGDERMAALSLSRDKLHGDWNDMIAPNRKRSKQMGCPC